MLNVMGNALVYNLGITRIILKTFFLGSSTLGEYFDPAVDCSDVVDRVPDAKDGFYWIYPKEIKTVVKVRNYNYAYFVYFLSWQ